MLRKGELELNKSIPQHTSNVKSALDTSSFSSTTLWVMKKVPEVTIFFWIIKLLTTAMGETTSDYLVRQLSPIIAVVLGGIGLAVALVLQFSVRQYVPWIYWLTVVMVAIFGTMCADVLHVGFGIPYFVSAAFFMVALVVIFAVWYMSEKTLSIHSIYTRRRELFYWATIITTFALGTACSSCHITTGAKRNHYRLT